MNKVILTPLLCFGALLAKPAIAEQDTFQLQPDNKIISETTAQFQASSKKAFSPATEYYNPSLQRDLTRLWVAHRHPMTPKQQFVWVKRSRRVSNEYELSTVKSLNDCPAQVELAKQSLQAYFMASRYPTDQATQTMVVSNAAKYANKLLDNAETCGQSFDAQRIYTIFAWFATYEKQYKTVIPKVIKALNDGDSFYKNFPSLVFERALIDTLHTGKVGKKIAQLRYVSAHADRLVTTIQTSDLKAIKAQLALYILNASIDWQHLIWDSKRVGFAEDEEYGKLFRLVKNDIQISLKGNQQFPNNVTLRKAFETHLLKAPALENKLHRSRLYMSEPTLTYQYLLDLVKQVPPSSAAPYANALAKFPNIPSIDIAQATETALSVYKQHGLRAEYRKLMSNIPRKIPKWHQKKFAECKAIRNQILEAFEKKQLQNVVDYFSPFIALRNDVHHFCAPEENFVESIVAPLIKDVTKHKNYFPSIVGKDTSQCKTDTTSETLASGTLLIIKERRCVKPQERLIKIYSQQAGSTKQTLVLRKRDEETPRSYKTANFTDADNDGIKEVAILESCGAGPNCTDSFYQYDSKANRMAFMVEIGSYDIKKVNNYFVTSSRSSCCDWAYSFYPDTLFKVPSNGRPLFTIYNELNDGDESKKTKCTFYLSDNLKKRPVAERKPYTNKTYLGYCNKNHRLIIK